MKPALGTVSADQRAAIQERLSKTGRAQVADIVSAEYATALREAAERVDFNIVTRRSTGHVDLPAAWLASLDPQRRQALGETVQASATDQFQYLFDNHPIFDMAQGGAAAPVWADLVAFLNSEVFLGLMRDLTGEPRIALADAQLTRFRKGHFLTEHDDTDDGKNRYFA